MIKEEEIGVNVNEKLLDIKAPTHLLELFEFLCQKFDEDTFPLQAISRVAFKLVNGWRITPESIKHLRGGSLEDEFGNEWFNIWTLGHVSPDVKLRIEHDGKIVWTSPRSGHIDMLLQIKKDGARLYEENAEITVMGTRENMDVYSHTFKLHDWRYQVIPIDR